MRTSSLVILPFAPLLVALALACGSPAFAEKAKPQPAAKVAKVAAKVQTPAPKAKPTKVPRNKNVEVTTEKAPVPASGPITLEHLITAALHHNPDVVRRKTEVEIAYWAKEAAKDWDEVELRLGYGTQSEIDVESPYTESGTSRGNFQGSNYSNSTESGTAFFRSDRERGTFRESRYRSWERRVIPGETSTKIIETEYESRKTSESGTNSRHQKEGLKVENRNTRTAEQSGRRVVGQTVYERKHQSTTEPDEDWSAMLRFRIPHPWERAAAIRAAEAEVGVANWELEAAKQETILKVRELYEKLVHLKVTARANQALADHRHSAANQTQTKIARAAEDASDASYEALEAKMKATEVIVELAMATGLNNLDRIAIPAALPLRRIDLGSLDKQYLVTMASKLNPQYQLYLQKHLVARAKVGEESAKKIPFASFLDAGLEQRRRANGADEDGYFFRLGISLPFFANTKNRSIDAARAEARAYSEQMGNMGQILDASIEAALSGMKAAEAAVKEVDEQYSLAKKFLVQAQGQAVFSEDLEKMNEAMNDTKELDLALSAQKLKFAVLYNTAVSRLEAALGVPLDKIMQREGK